MFLTELTESEKPAYNRFLMVQNGSFLQSWEWGEWQIRLGRIVYRFKIADDRGAQIGSVQFIKMPLLLGKYYLYAPYGPVTNFKFQISDFRLMTQLLQQKFPDAMFLRIEPQNSSLIFNHASLTKSTNIQPAVTIMVDLRGSSEAILAAMHPKTRYNIKVAQKHGIAIVSQAANAAQNFDEVVNLILATQVRQRYRGHSKEYYQKLLHFFADKSAGDLHSTIYKAFYGAELIVAGVMVDFGNVRMYLYGGSSENHRNTMAPYLMHWQAMQDAKTIGITQYDLGGSEAASKGEQGFTRFKQGFGGNLVSYAGTYDAIFRPIEYKIYGIMRVVNRAFKK